VVSENTHKLSFDLLPRKLEMLTLMLTEVAPDEKPLDLYSEPQHDPVLLLSCKSFMVPLLVNALPSPFFILTVAVHPLTFTWATTILVVLPFQVQLGYAGFDVQIPAVHWSTHSPDLHSSSDLHET